MIQEGPFATVSKTWTSITDGVPQWIVVKSATTLRKFTKEPHDIVKELRLLSSMTHANIAFVIGSFLDDEQNMLNIYMPYFAMSLSSLLASPYLSPHPFPPLTLHAPNTDTDAATHDEQFNIIARSIMIQTLAALAFLHSEQRRIGHRDIKPENIMLATDGCVKLIDFGVSWNETELDLEKNHDLWPEYKGKLYFEVSTRFFGNDTRNRAYRAPELLFGSRNYDHCAIDLWSVGATFAEFFTPLRLVSDDEDDGDDDDDTDPDAEGEPEHVPLEPFIVPKYLRIGYPGAQWKRNTLFNGERGEIGLAWSIFKIFGTPTEANWPDFEELPGATSVVFNVVPAVPLRPLFPNLPPSSLSPMLESFNPNPNLSLSPSPSCSISLSSPDADFASPPPFLTSPLGPSSASSSSLPPAPLSLAPSDLSPSPSPSLLTNQKPPTPLSPIIDLLSRFLTYPPAARLSAEDAMRHPWFTAPGAVLLLPPGYSLQWNMPLGRSGERERDEKVERYEWRGRALEEWLNSVLGGKSLS
ncbi:hypothetical protein CVT25_009614 [Psilocybe cyanescens]|uniref:cyclin-dependent kinase n=1 Tax=Psilocybe cyanescens TaxID=93625 RepID=A0A409XGU9_PSICY|nr:hypothetical protein CVT25_009614 [Psilocybe cyanescens]